MNFHNNRSRLNDLLINGSKASKDKRLNQKFSIKPLKSNKRTSKTLIHLLKGRLEKMGRFLTQKPQWKRQIKFTSGKLHSVLIKKNNASVLLVKMQISITWTHFHPRTRSSLTTAANFFQFSIWFQGQALSNVVAQSRESQQYTQSQQLVHQCN